MTDTTTTGADGPIPITGPDDPATDGVSDGNSAPFIGPPPPGGPAHSQPMIDVRADVPVEPPRNPTPLDRRWVIAGVAAAVAGDLALRRPPLTNVAGTILILVLAAGLLGSGFLTSRASRLLAGGAAFFALFLSIRTEPILLALNLLAAFGLLVLAAIHGQGRRSFWDLRPLRILADGGAVLGTFFTSMGEVPIEASARLRVAKEQAANGSNQTGFAILRGLAITVPVVAILGLLLASADVVFHSFFNNFGLFDISTAIGHLILAGLGAFAMLVLLRLANDQGSASVSRSTRSLGTIETGVLLVSVNLLFAAFAVAQLLTIVGGADEALERANLDPKQFARQGFFQLLWVAGLTLALLMTVHVLTSENVKARRLTRMLTPVTVLLTVLIVAVAFTRIQFYIDDGGLTPLRLYSSVFAIWIAIAFVITAVRVGGIRPTRDWLLPVLLLSGLGMLAALNIVSPERVIAGENLGRGDSAIIAHVQAGQYSGEGEAILAERLDELPPEVAAEVAIELCADHLGRGDTDAGWLATNLGHRRGTQALGALCAG